MKTVIELAEKLAKPSRLLIVDDESSFLGLVARGVSDLNVEIHMSTSAEDTIERLQKGERYDCILLDLIMKGPSGVDVLKFMKSNDINTPVILITGYPDHHLLSAAKEYGAIAILYKPIEIKDLKAELSRYFTMYKIKH